MKSFMRPGMKFPVVTSDNTKLKPWRQQVSGVALSIGATPIDGPVSVTVDFFFQRPRSAAKRIGMTVKPDIDKLARAILDSLTGILFHDDAQVISLQVRKFYETPERAEIHVDGAN